MRTVAAAAVAAWASGAEAASLVSTPTAAADSIAVDAAGDLRAFASCSLTRLQH